MPKKIIAAFLALAAVVAAFAVWPEDIENYPPENPGGPVVAFGDSLVYGTGSTEGNDFVSLLSRAIGEPIVNLGVPGDTTRDGLERLPDVIHEAPRVTLVLLGGNDYLRKVPIEETFANLRQIISALQDSGSIVVLLGVRGGLLSDRFDTYYKQLAEETGSVYVSDVLSGLIADSRYMSDAVHPNDSGYARIAERVYEEAQTVLRR